jgi:hypothetical protein
MKTTLFYCVECNYYVSKNDYVVVSVLYSESYCTFYFTVHHQLLHSNCTHVYLVVEHKIIYQYINSFNSDVTVKMLLCHFSKLFNVHSYSALVHIERFIVVIYFCQ